MFRRAQPTAFLPPSSPPSITFESYDAVPHAVSRPREDADYTFAMSEDTPPNELILAPEPCPETEEQDMRPPDDTSLLDGPGPLDHLAPPGDVLHPNDAALPNAYDASATQGFGSSSYARTHKKLFALLAELYRTGIQDIFQFNLPQIAVVGSQSVGKSSLIEAVSGIKLPRESGTCTRCPMECRLEHTPDGEWSCEVSIVIESRGRTPIPFGDTLRNPEQVEDRLRRAQRAVLQPELSPESFLSGAERDSPRPRRSFTKDRVCVHVRAPDITDLHFFDLPGVIVNVEDGKDEADIDLVQNMVRGYVQRPGCISLLVVACETDFLNQAAAKIVRELDPKGLTTVGVLTKPDRVSEDNATYYQSMSRQHPLRSGWFVVKLPDSTDLRNGISREEAARKAEHFFASHDMWRDYAARNKERIGVQQLTQHLSARLSRQLHDEIPRIREFVKNELQRVESALDAVPKPRIGNPFVLVNELMTTFTDSVHQHVNGTSQLDLTRLGLVQSLLGVYDQFKRDICGTAPAFDARKSHNAEVLVDVDGDGHERVVPHGGTIPIEDVQSAAKEARTRELPGNVPFSVKKHYIDQFLSTWDVHAKSCLNLAYQSFASQVERLVHQHFDLYSANGLVAVIQAAVGALLRNRLELTKAEAVRALSRETEVLLTLNEQYFFACKDKFIAAYKGARLKRSPSVPQDEPAPEREYAPVAAQRSQTRNHSYQQQPRFWYLAEDPAQAVLLALRQLGSEYNRVTVADLAKLLPDDEAASAIDIMAEVRAYFQVAYKRVIDAVPQLIEEKLIRGFAQGLTEALITGLRLDEPNVMERCKEWVAEAPEVTTLRRNLEARRSALHNAHQALLQYGTE